MPDSSEWPPVHEPTDPMYKETARTNPPRIPRGAKHDPDSGKYIGPHPERLDAKTRPNRKGFRKLIYSLTSFLKQRH